MVERLVLPSTKHLAEEDRVLLDFESEVTMGEIMPYGSPELARFSEDLIASKVVWWNVTGSDGEEIKPTGDILREMPGTDVIYLRAKLRFSHGVSEEDQKAVILYASAMRDGSSISREPPVEYILYLYRKKFRISYEEALRLPASVIQQDFLFSELEADSGELEKQ